MSYVLGLDGGNTKTIALVARLDGAILGVGRAGCSDIYGAVSADAALGEARAAASAALTMAGIQPGALLAGGFSIAGADWPEDIEFLHAAFEGLGEKHLIVNDAIGALRAGSPDGTGVVVVCGTGAATGARNAAGRIWHTSFWQEPQGAQELGRKALRAVYRAALGIDPPTTLTARILDIFGQRAVEDLLHLFTARLGAHPDISQVARLARVLLDEASGGDPVACGIVEAHGAALGDYALAAARQVQLGDAPFPLVLAGGVFRHSGRALANALIDRVQSQMPNARPTFSRFEPAVGAVLLALELVGVTVDQSVLKQVEASLPPAALFET